MNMAQQTSTEPKQGDTELETPIKINWTGYARGRISEYNADYSEPEEDSTISPERFLKAVNRQKTNLVVKTVEEAEAVRNELTSYDSDQRTWMNSSQDRSLNRVATKLTEGMEERGYEDQWEMLAGMASFKGYEPVGDDEDSTEDEGEQEQDTTAALAGDLLERDPADYGYTAKLQMTETQVAVVEAALEAPSRTQEAVAEAAGCTERYANSTLNRWRGTEGEVAAVEDETLTFVPQEYTAD